MSAAFTYRIDTFANSKVNRSQICDLNTKTTFFNPNKEKIETFGYMNKIILKRPTTFLLVAVDCENTLLGYAAFYTNEVAAKALKNLKKNEAYLSSIVVDEPFRQKGIATKFYQAFFEKFPSFQHIIEEIDHPDIVTKDGKKLIPAKLRDLGYRVTKVSGDHLRSKWKISALDEKDL